MKCPYCFADGVFGGLRETCRDLANCNNCTVDIALGGNWTGYGMAALKALTKRDGADAVADEWNRQRKEKKESERARMRLERRFDEQEQTTQGKEGE